MMTEQELTDKIKALVEERDNLWASANAMVARYNGKIEAYHEWLKTLQPLSKSEIQAIAGPIFADAINGNSE